jgi:hypothetical protein
MTQAAGLRRVPLLEGGFYFGNGLPGGIDKVGQDVADGVGVIAKDIG